MDLNAVLSRACDAGASDLHLNGSKLTISGTVFIDGNVQITTPNTSPALYPLYGHTG